jgi:hypothetical protein
MNVNIVSSVSSRKAALSNNKKTAPDPASIVSKALKKKEASVNVPEYIDCSCPPARVVKEGPSCHKIDCSKQIRACEINYNMVASVISTWDRVLLIPDWSRVAGESFMRHIFRIEPATISLFGFPADTKWDDPALSDNKTFTRKGINLIKAIDMAVSFLGPDLEPLENELYKIGYGHTAMKALPNHWPIVGEALLSVFDECLKDAFSESERMAWIKVCLDC